MSSKIYEAITATVKAMFPDRVTVVSEEDIFTGAKIAVPCAVGHDITEDMVEKMQPDGLIIGSENNQMAQVKLPGQKAGIPDPNVINALMQKGILHLPDPLANLGGALAVDVEFANGTLEDAQRYVKGIYPLAIDIFNRAIEGSRTTQQVYEEIIATHYAKFIKAYNISLDHAA